MTDHSETSPSSSNDSTPTGSDLPKTFSPADIEARIYRNWSASGVFAADARSKAPPYTIMMPPPNVTGSLHIGHALTFTLQDVLIRYRRMRGDDALWQPGTDHAGIATQMVVERQLAAEGKSRHDLGREGFVDRVWSWKAESGGTIVNQLRRLGASPDWERERFTMDEGLSLAVRKVFVDLYRQGLIYRDKRLVNWDPKLLTAISDLEVVQKEIQGHLWHFRYPLADDPTQSIVVATTRPETMLGDTAVAVHPDDPRYRSLIGKAIRLPIVGREIPIVADDYADPETGSGAVKITPAHDFNDFEVGRRHALDMINIFDAEARINQAAPEEFRGLDRFEARKRVVAAFEALGLVERIDAHTHMVPHGDRSGVPIEPWLTDQWYCDAATLAKPAIEAVETGKTVFVPKQWENTYFEWMRNIQPWCISRQLWWGHQIPAWFGPDGEIFVAMTEEEAATLAAAHYGAPTILRRDEDVLDTWFSSALWPFSTLGWPDETVELGRYYPGDVLVTGFDIIFFWVARMMMMGLHFMGDVPFRTVYIHALVRDEHGQKMAKSKGNVIDPLVLIDRYGADAIRFTLAALAAQGRDIKLAEARVEGSRNFATKLWNAARFTKMNGCNYDSGFAPDRLTHPLNRWIVTAAGGCGRSIESAMDSYRFNDAANAIYHFAWHQFCDWYLEFTKPILSGDDVAARSETQKTTAWVFAQILHMLHPLMPFATEELWADLAGHAGRPCGEGRWLIERRWPKIDPATMDAAAKAEIEWVIDLITQVRAVRTEMNVPPGAKVPLVLTSASDTARDRANRHGDLVSRLARISDFSVSSGEPAKGSVQIVLDGAVAAMPIADVIDIDQERLRLSKELDKYARDIEGIDKKLSNPSFVEKAPEAVVAEQRSRREAAQDSLTKIEAALARLSGLSG